MKYNGIEIELEICLLESVFLKLSEHYPDNYQVRIFILIVSTPVICSLDSEFYNDCVKLLLFFPEKERNLD